MTATVICLYGKSYFELAYYLHEYLPPLGMYKCIFENILPWGICESKIVSGKRGDLLKFIAINCIEAYDYHYDWFMELYESFVRLGIDDWFRSVGYREDIRQLCFTGGTTIEDLKIAMKSPDITVEGILRVYCHILSYDAVDYLTDISNKFSMKYYRIPLLDIWESSKVELLLAKGFLTEDDAREMLGR